MCMFHQTGNIPTPLLNTTRTGRLLHILRAYGPSFIPLPAAIRRRREDGGPTALWAAALPTRSSN